MSDATFITQAMVEDELSSLTTSRLPMAVSAQNMARACRRVVTLIKGASVEVPAQADAPTEWQFLAVEWLAAKMYARFPEYFRAKYETIEEVETRIARTARVDPPENQTYVASLGTSADAWDYDPQGRACGCGGTLP